MIKFRLVPCFLGEEWLDNVFRIRDSCRRYKNSSFYPRWGLEMEAVLIHRIIGKMR